MKAVVLTGVTPAREVCLAETAAPAVKPGWVLVKVMAFGLNHSEKILRLNEIRADYIQKPVIPGIECAGVVADASDTPFKAGQKVIAFMGGMGRSFNGSYAEFALLPARHVFAAESDLPWEQLGAVPETFFTAWGSLFEGLRLKAGETLFLRGGTCALGYAAIQQAKAHGCEVAATAHRAEKLPLLREAGADVCLLDESSLAEKVCADKALELVGPKTLADTLRCVKAGGIVCNTGNLGGEYFLNGFDPIKQIPNGVYLTGFFSNYPARQTVADMLEFLRRHKIRPKIGAVYKFLQIRQACIDLDEGRSNGKIVVLV